MSLIANLFGRSPIRPMQQHMHAAVACARAVLPLLEDMVAGRVEKLPLRVIHHPVGLREWLDGSAGGLFESRLHEGGQRVTIFIYPRRHLPELGGLLELESFDQRDRFGLLGTRPGEIPGGRRGLREGLLDGRYLSRYLIVVDVFHGRVLEVEGVEEMLRRVGAQIGVIQIDDLERHFLHSRRISGLLHI